MSEMMLFPKTWEEFEEQYGFYDIKQAYMFGNTRLIPSFRVEQWLDHIDDIKRKKQSQANKMEHFESKIQWKRASEARPVKWKPILFTVNSGETLRTGVYDGERFVAGNIARYRYFNVKRVSWWAYFPPTPLIDCKEEGNNDGR